MDVLALYDIHGNLDALQAVLADDRAAGVDAIVVGGDAVPGPEAAAVIGRLGAQTVPTHWIRGNGEREVAEAARAGVAERDLPPDAMPERWAAATAATLDARTAAELGGLPLTLELDGVLYCHASPRRDDEMLTRISPAAAWTDALAGVAAPLVVAGHTHQQDDRTVGGVRFVNAGSVGLPYEGDSAARWARVRDGAVALYATAYDGASAGRRMLEAGWPDQESFRAALIDPIDPAEITRIFEAGR